MNKVNKNLISFTLIELLIVITIIAVLSVAAIPAYEKYVIRAQIETMWRDIEAAKLAVTSDFYKFYTFASSNYATNSVDFTTKNSDYVSSIVVQNGVITVQGDSSKFFNNNIWIKWTPSILSDDLSWQCSYSPDAAAFINSDYCQ